MMQRKTGLPLLDKHQQHDIETGAKAKSQQPQQQQLANSARAADEASAVTLNGAGTPAAQANGAGTLTPPTATAKEARIEH